MEVTAMNKLFGDANCRDCGALVKPVDHDCKPVNYGIIGAIEKTGRDAIKAEIVKMSDDDLVRAVSVICESRAVLPDRFLIAELAYRFRTKMEDDT
jgi:hypothetical protein